MKGGGVGKATKLVGTYMHDFLCILLQAVYVCNCKDILHGQSQ